MDFGTDTALSFMLISVVMGGGAAWLAGRAIALTWRPLWHALLYMVLLGGVVRFMHYALADGTLLSPVGYVIDTAVAGGFASAGFLVMRRSQRQRQYGFLSAAPNGAPESGTPPHSAATVSKPPA